MYRRDFLLSLSSAVAISGITLPRPSPAKAAPRPLPRSWRQPWLHHSCGDLRRDLYGLKYSMVLLFLRRHEERSEAVLEHLSKQKDTWLFDRYYFIPIDMDSSATIIDFKGREVTMRQLAANVGSMGKWLREKSPDVKYSWCDLPASSGVTKPATGVMVHMSKELEILYHTRHLTYLLRHVSIGRPTELGDLIEWRPLFIAGDKYITPPPDLEHGGGRSRPAKDGKGIRKPRVRKPVSRQKRQHRNRRQMKAENSTNQPSRRLT